jgi:hypothetical protein
MWLGLLIAFNPPPRPENVEAPAVLFCQLLGMAARKLRLVSPVYALGHIPTNAVNHVNGLGALYVFGRRGEGFRRFAIKAKAKRLALCGLILYCIHNAS